MLHEKEGSQTVVGWDRVKDRLGLGRPLTSNMISITVVFDLEGTG